MAKIRVYDSLGNEMYRCNTEEQAVNFIQTFGNSHWKLVWKR